MICRRTLHTLINERAYATCPYGRSANVAPMSVGANGPRTRQLPRYVTAERNISVGAIQRRNRENPSTEEKCDRTNALRLLSLLRFFAGNDETRRLGASDRPRPYTRSPHTCPFLKFDMYMLLAIRASRSQAVSNKQPMTHLTIKLQNNRYNSTIIYYIDIYTYAQTGMCMYIHIHVFFHCP